MMPGTIPEMELLNDTTAESILNSLMDKKNLELKTEIEKPREFARLKMLAGWLNQDKLPSSATLVDEFMTAYMEYQVSNKRKGRGEVIHALAERMKAVRSLTDKMMGGPGERVQ